MVVISAKGFGWIFKVALEDFVWLLFNKSDSDKNMGVPFNGMSIEDAVIISLLTE